jgi:hypothetical protein
MGYRCGIVTCEFSEVTREGTRRYMHAMRQVEADITARREEQAREARYRARRDQGCASLSDAANGWTAPSSPRRSGELPNCPPGLAAKKSR